MRDGGFYCNIFAVRSFPTDLAPFHPLFPAFLGDLTPFHGYRRDVPPPL
jgi:hypothetical protein